MCSTHVLCIESNLAQSILKYWPAQVLKQDFYLFYGGQIPNVAAFMPKGEARSIADNKVCKIVSPSLIGATELLNKVDADCSVQILKGSRVSLFDRVALRDYLKENQDFIKLAQ